MRKPALSTAFLGAILASFALVAPAQAQATRTWVSGVGDDVNPCSRTAPCKTFAGAISKTAAGGEINCLDPGGFGAVTITKAIHIHCDYTEGGVLASTINGVIINAGVNDEVYLSGLDIEGAGNGLTGIRFLAGRALHVRNSTIRGFTTNGIEFAPSGFSVLTVQDTVIADNVTATTNAGVKVRPTGSGSARVALTRVQMLNNTIGFLADSSGSTGTTRVNIESSVASGNTADGFGAVGGSAQQLIVVINNSAASNNGQFGFIAAGGNSFLLLGNSTVTGNGTGLGNLNGGLLQSYGNNRVQGNVADGIVPGIIPTR